MRTIAHISDLHFGTVDQRVAGALARDLHERRPSLVVVSGDLTQRGRRGQYQAAADYLKSLPQPQLVVPGNHDIPLVNVVRRFFFSLRRYRRHITRDLRPMYQDEELAVVGINTARSFAFDWRAFWKGGRISEEQLLDLRLRLCPIPPTVLKVIVTHHPFLPAPGEPNSDLVGRAAESLAVFEECGVDMLLSGHLHLGYSGDVLSHHTQARRSILSIHASTATSTRRRGEPNAYNWIAIEDNRVGVEVRAWDGERFTVARRTRYAKVNDVWREERGDDQIRNSKFE